MCQSFRTGCDNKVPEANPHLDEWRGDIDRGLYLIIIIIIIIFAQINTCYMTHIAAAKKIYSHTLSLNLDHIVLQDNSRERTPCGIFFSLIKQEEALRAIIMEDQAMQRYATKHSMDKE